MVYSVVVSITDLRDLDAAFAIREKVFVEEQHVPLADEYDAHDRHPATRHYLARAATPDGPPAGAARWRQTAHGIKLERFAVLPEFRNQQLGAALLTKVLHDVRAEFPTALVYLHAQLRAVPFYARHGFVAVGEMFEECAIQHYKMVFEGGGRELEGGQKLPSSDEEGSFGPFTPSATA